MDGVAVCGDGGGWTKDVKEAKWRSGGEDRVDVFDAMGFVDDNVLERNFLRGLPFRSSTFRTRLREHGTPQSYLA